LLAGVQVWDPLMGEEMPLRDVTDALLDNKEEYGPLIFLQCGHICFMSGLDGWMELQDCYQKSDEDDWIGLKQLEQV
jgi:hypothetical protein